MSIIISSLENTVTISSSTNNVTVEESGIIASPAQISRLYDPATVVRQFTEGYDIGNFVSLNGASGVVSFSMSSGGLPSPLLFNFSGFAERGFINMSSTGSSTPGAAAAQVRSSAAGADLVVIPGNCAYKIQGLMGMFFVNTAATDVPNQRAAFGFWSSNGASPTDALFFRCGLHQSTTTGTTWRACSIVASGALSEIDTGVSVNLPATFSIEINQARTQVLYKINGAIVRTINGSASIPTAAMHGGCYFSNHALVGTMNMFVDYMVLDQHVSR